MVTRPLIEYGRTGQPLDIPVLDVHAHIGSFASTIAPALERQVEEMKRVGVRWQIVSSVEGIHGDIVWGNDQAAHAAHRYRGILFAYCHVSGQYPELMESELERCFADPVFRGIKVYQAGTPYDHPVYEPVWRFASTRHLPVLAHTWGGNLTGLDRVALQYPDVPFLMGHSGSGFAWEAYLEAARKAPNLYLDLTYSREHTNMIEHFVEAVGSSRIVWGSDAPTFSLSHQIGKILFARISDEDKRAILFYTSARLFGFQP
jgi:predicted TIM-barrel fold metal-dependent hydrolase